MCEVPGPRIENQVIRGHLISFAHLCGVAFMLPMPGEPGSLDKLNQVNQKDVEAAIDKIVRGYKHRFGESTKYDLLHLGRRFPSKAVLGIAAEKYFGRQLKFDDFGARDAFDILRRLGFNVVPKGTLRGVPYADEATSASEGAKMAVTVNRYERDPMNRTACITHFGSRCQICDLDFGATYGPHAVGYIHVHHITPLSEVGEEHQVDP